MPAVQLFTGAHEDYHRPTDDVEKIDADGMAKVAVVSSSFFAMISGVGVANVLVTGSFTIPAMKRMG